MQCPIFSEHNLNRLNFWSISFNLVSLLVDANTDLKMVSSWISTSAGGEYPLKLRKNLQKQIRHSNGSNYKKPNLIQTYLNKKYIEVEDVNK